MRRFGIALSAALLACALAGCQTAPAAGSSPESLPPGDAPDEAAVLAAYEAAAEVYDWFDLCPLPSAGDPVTLDGKPYDPQADGIPYQAVEFPEVETYAGLEARVRASFAPAVADGLLEGPGYRDIGGRLYTLGGGRGRNLYLLDRTEEAARVDEDHWAVTATFWADFTESKESVTPEGDARSTPVAVAGYSQAVLDYEKTAEGWRFTSFCPTDGLDLEADTVFTFDYAEALETAAYESYTDFQLACYLIHADGAYAEAPFDLLFQRFLERPEDILDVLALLDGSPYGEVEVYNTDYLAAFPAYHAANGHTIDEQITFEGFLNGLQPETPEAQAVLDRMREAFAEVTAGNRVDADNQFSFSVHVGGDAFGMLCLGAQENQIREFPWGFNLKGTLVSTGSDDCGGTYYEMDCGALTLAYSVSPDDGTEYIYRIVTDQPGVITDYGVQVGDTEEAVQAAYPEAVTLGAVGEWQIGADYALIYEPGGWAFCKHIAFFIKDGTVVQIEMEDLMDGRLLS